MQTKLSWDPLVLEPVFNSIYSLAMKDKKDYLPDMYQMETSEKDTETVDGIGGEGLMEEWSRSGNSVSYSDIAELWKKQFVMRKYSGGRVIDRDLVDDLKVADIKRRITGLADAVYKTRQMQGVETFNNAFVASGQDFAGYTVSTLGPDGIALCSASHPYSPTNTTDVQSNFGGTNALSWTEWDKAVTAMMSWVDDKGNLMAVMPDTLMVGPANRAKAFQIAGMPGKDANWVPGSGNYSMNVYEGDIKVIVNPFLKNQYNWFAIDSARMKQFHLWFDRRKPEYGQNTDFNTETMQYKVIGRWQKGFSNYSWVYGVNATT